MDYATYEVESRIEQTHWWFVVRRKLFLNIIEELNLPQDAHILDIGTSTGTNLRLLKEMGFTNVDGLDIHDEAIRWCAEKGLGRVNKGDICNIPFSEQTFDLVLATDIVEHVDDDEQALREIRRVLKNNGYALLTVPAFESLWGLQDEVSHHKRRYRMADLKVKLERAGFVSCEAFYFNYLLFLPIWLARQLIRYLRIHLASENEINNRLINKVLMYVFFIDIRLARKLRVPFGVSACALLRVVE